jgi:hypothetical protein
MNCAFCPNRLDGSEEHIILNGLGGVRSSTRIICSICNQRFGNTIDKALLEALEPYTLILDPPTRRQSIGTRKRLFDANGDEYEMTAGGKIKVRYKQIAPNQWIADVADTGHVTANTDAAAKALQERSGQPVSTNVSHGSRIPGPFNLQMRLDNFTAIRALMKWALNLLAVEVLSGDDLQLAFPKIERDFVDKGIGEPLAGFLDRSLIPGMFGGLEHYVALFRTSNGSVYWEASAYGGAIAAAGRTAPIETPFQATLYRVDPITGRYSTNALTGDLLPDDFCLWVPTHDATCLARTNVTSARLTYEMNLRQGRETIVDDCLKEHLPTEGAITKQHTAAAARCIGERFIALVRQLRESGMEP